MGHENPYRRDFPLLEKNSVIYLDSAATAQKPSCVLQAERDFMSVITPTQCGASML